MKAKKTKSVLMASLCLLTTAVSAGCGPKKADTENTLEIAAVDAGYGVNWLYKMIDAFKEQDWVKEKYGDSLNILTPTINDDQTFASNRIKAGAKNNSIDLIFGLNLSGFAGVDSSGVEWLADLTEDVFNQNVPGEDILFKDKLDASYLNSLRFTDTTAATVEDKYYYSSWANVYGTFLYNEDILKAVNVGIPNTTDEFVAACETIKNNYKVDGLTDFYCFIQGKDESYWSYPFNVWWAQYEGFDGYDDFYNGVYRGAYSTKIFEQKGRVRALEVYEDLLDFDKGYLNPASLGLYEFMTAQSAFLQGLAAFNMNGDWFAYEMSGVKENMIKNGKTPANIKMMRMPILSSIIEKTPSIKDDATLSAVVSAIDNGEKSYEGVTEKDFAKIKEAREVIYSIGPLHNVAIPSYANGKEPAKDFIRFMATDIAQEIYIKETEGASLPFKYDMDSLQTKNVEAYNAISDFQWSRLNYVYNKNYTPKALPIIYNYPLVKFGGLAAFNKTNFYEVFSMQGNSKTPDDYYNDTIKLWTQGKFDSALAAAGFSAK